MDHVSNVFWSCVHTNGMRQSRFFAIRVDLGLKGSLSLINYSQWLFMFPRTPSAFRDNMTSTFAVITKVFLLVVTSNMSLAFAFKAFSFRTTKFRILESFPFHKITKTL